MQQKERREAARRLVERFDFARVQTRMKRAKSWDGGNRPPGIGQLRKYAAKQIERALSNGFGSTMSGGFRVTYDGHKVALDFEVGDDTRPIRAVERIRKDAR